MSNLQNLAVIEILLVEDSPSDAELTIETFSESKILNRIHVAEDGVEALDFLLKRGKYKEAPRPDLILLDLNLPKKNGREVLTEIKTHPELQTIPVVVLTTSDAEEDILRSYQLHANCYITKPVDFEQFTKIVKLISDFWFAAVRLPPTPS
ncbi:MAG: response regulator [Oscillatoriophycideae cyanobacterium NC_groundwater_1537_Pr4_S-0.65um_50_18]|nr:response regulator [Oscillatoriophycideae cyanobacterium NC_groundwater_1537_Pr4_S-0.65um_50_18]